MMADKESKDTEKKEVKEGKSPILKIIIGIILIVVIGGGGAFGGYYFYKQYKEPKPITEIKVEALKDLTVNLSDEGTPRYVKTSVTISYDEKDSKAAEEITAKTPEINDKITFFLKSRKAADFDASNEENLKKQLVEDLNKIMFKGKIVNVYFPNGILVQ